MQRDEAVKTSAQQVYFKLYQDLHNKAEQDKLNYEMQLEKCNGILNTLTSKLEFINIKF